MSQTPLFDAAIDKILAPLVPHTRTCAETGEAFDITQRDIDMLRALRVPPPKTAWWARLRQKRACIAGFDLFRRDASDGTSAVSMYDPASPVPILPPAIWYSDEFDPMQYGGELKSEEPFFAQWETLSKKVPHPAIIQDANSANSQWSLYSLAYKNCYFCHTGLDNEDCQYLDMSMHTKHSTDAASTHSSEWCYETVGCRGCSQTFFSEHCEESVDLWFCLACKNCQSCFGCTNLRNKKNCFLNEQLTEEEYKKRVGAIDLANHQVVEEWMNLCKEKIFRNTFRLAGLIFGSEQAVGDDLEDCQDVEGFIMKKSERTYYGFGAVSGKDSMDFTNSVEFERCYSVNRTTQGYENRFTHTCASCIDVEYSELLTNCEHCFGCIGLKNKKHCIFNTQYTEEEYWQRVDAIKIAMLARGEYGEFFSYAFSPFAYNTSLSGAMFPLSQEEATKLGARWYEFPPEKDPAVLPIESLPTELSKVDASVLEKRFLCPVTKRSFTIVKPELEFHKQFNIALPRVHSSLRRKRRQERIFPPRLYTRACGICQAVIHTRIPSAYTAPVLCRDCYEKVVIGEKEVPTIK